MKTTILSIGTRGDIQPLVALAKGLQKQGHSVRLATHSNFKQWIEEHNIEFFPVQGDSHTLLSTETGMRFLESGTNPFLCAPRWFNGVLGDILEGIILDCWNASEGCDLLIGSGTTPWSPDIAIGRGVPFIHATQWPIYPSVEYLPFLVSQKLRAGKFLTMVLHNLLGAQMWFYVRKPLNKVRVEHMGLRPTMISPLAADNWKWVRGLVAASPHVFAKPSNWGDNMEVTGPWFLDAPDNSSLTRETLDFLAAGPTPVCIGFSSVTGRHPARFTRLLVDAVKKAGQRAILLSGWGAVGGGDIPSDILVIEGAPHDQLFPHVSAVVSHGGAGTTWATMRAGIPAIIVPFCGDQRFWGHRAAAIGVGPEPIPFSELTVDRLATAIGAAVNNQGMRQRARELGEKIRADDGVANAIRFIDRNLSQKLHSRTEQ